MVDRCQFLESLGECQLLVRREKPKTRKGLKLVPKLKEWLCDGFDSDELVVLAPRFRRAEKSVEGG